MSGWSPTDAIAMERRHIIEGEQIVARQEMIVSELIEKRHDRLVGSANDLLDLFRDLLEVSRGRLRDLERRYGNATEV
jgi:hypothetical protein